MRTEISVETTGTKVTLKDGTTIEVEEPGGMTITVNGQPVRMAVLAWWLLTRPLKEALEESHA